MKEATHPVVFRDRAANPAFLTRSTATSARTITWQDGAHLSRRRRRDLISEPPVLHRAGARPRHGRPGRAVPPPVRHHRQGHLRPQAAGAPGDHGPPDSRAGRPVPRVVGSSPTRLTSPVCGTTVFVAGCSTST